MRADATRLPHIISNFLIEIFVGLILHRSLRLIFSPMVYCAFKEIDPNDYHRFFTPKIASRGRHYGSAAHQ